MQSPMGKVILGGLLTSTFLNMVVVPVLFKRFGARGGAKSDKRLTDTPETDPGTGPAPQHG